jgi:membrane protease YdiL (CAAX protease family)
LFGLTWLRFGWPYWIGLISVTVATVLVIGIWERGQWPLGLFIAPPVAAREFAIGVAFGAVLIGACTLLISSSTNVRHAGGRGFPWLELLAVYAPAALHEELLFRGYPFQKLLQRNRTFAYLFVAFVFAVLHSGNNGVTLLALGNVFLGGILLGFAYERYRHLWFPFGLHLSWNLMTGPILGDQVSGYTGEASVFVERGGGAWWLTGGNFGIEGSVWMTAVELAAIAILVRRHMIRSKEQTT